jgi:hypothetical protein
MSEQTKSTQPDKNMAAEQRPVPSQAEGDERTVEEDLERREKEEQSSKK